MPRHFLAALLAFLLTAAQAFAAETKVYPLPEGAGPHDAAPAPDGKVWYTAQGAGALGILDPATGEVRQVPLGEGSAPHGVIPGPDGAAWITDGGQNAIVRYDSRTGEIKRWPLPAETGFANLNTATFDRKGALWFTGQSGIYGSLEPATGRMRVWKDPDGAGPYGITTTPDGRVFYASLAGSHIAEIDTATGEQAPHRPAEPGAGRPPRLGRRPGQTCGSASGTRAGSPATRPRAVPGRTGASPAATARTPTRSTSTSAARSGSATGAPTPS